MAAILVWRLETLLLPPLLFTSMKNVAKQIKHAIYARKSSEAEDRQALSIESQISEDQSLTRRQGIRVDEDFILSESHSAKTPYQRPVFEQLIKRVEKGSVQGIIAWHPNRLSRNAIDSARLVDLMDRGLLHEIVTPSQTFRNTPSDKFFFTMLTSQAKLENDNKGVDVKRGLRNKYEQGVMPGMAKVGYLNDYGKKGTRKILPDPERFERVKKMFEMFLTGKYSVREIHRYSDDVLGLRTIQRTKEGGKPIKLSQLYRTLKDSYYAGFFYAFNENGERHEYEVDLAVPRMITREQHYRILSMMGCTDRPRPQTHKNLSAYSGITRCHDCGGPVTAELKHQIICSGCRFKFSYLNKEECPSCGLAVSKMKSATYLRYVYLHCSRWGRKGCRQKSIEERKADVEMVNYVRENLEISPALNEWFLAHVDELEKKDANLVKDVRVAWERELTTKEREYDGLVSMRAKTLIEEDKFVRLSTSLLADIEGVKEKLNATAGTRSEVARKAIMFSTRVSDVFLSDDFDAKKDALIEMSQNLTLNNKTLNVSLKKSLQILVDGLLSARAENSAFEPRNIVDTTERNDVFMSVRPTLLRG